ncbi:MAG: cytochrome C [Acidobacteria bacterium]|nr:cytochrome C [Acidobacteriota bacterium]
MDSVQFTMDRLEVPVTPLSLRARILCATVLLSALPASAQVALPEGPGKALVERACVVCHTLEKLAGPDGGHWPAFGPGKSRDEWRRVMAFMLSYGTPLSKADAAVVTDYLATAFPGPPRPAGVRIAGPVDASIREWKIPTAGTRPHDPAVAPDGGVWYTSQAKSRLGRLDPATGQFREYPLKADNPRLPYGVGPHGLTADRDGAIWYTGQMDGHLGRLDPKTGAVTKYKMPEGAGGPHTPIFDRTGTLWFTLQQGNMVGRLVPATGEMKFVTMPTARSEPYGIVINSKGVPFFTQLMGNRIGTIDPATLQPREFFVGSGSGPRRLAITPDDLIYYTDYARGILGRLDPATDRTKEWRSPSGPLSQPYAIAAVENIIWYVEGNAMPNMVVRFDPAAETFQTWPMPSGGGVVRHMVVAPDRRLWLAGSEVDVIATVEVTRVPPVH